MAGRPAIAPRVARSFGGPIGHLNTGHGPVRESQMTTKSNQSRSLQAVLPLLLFLTSILIGCSNVSDTPIVPDANAPSVILNSAGDDINAHQMWYAWDVRIDPDILSAEIAPARELSAHWDVTSYLNTPGRANSIAFSNLHYVEPDALSVTVDINHPFPGQPSLNCFDVKGIVMSYPDIDFSSGGVSMILKNADGWTARWPGDECADINPYIDFAIENPERRFESGAIHSRELIIRVPDGNPLEFTYVIDACWLPESMIDPGNPSLSPHCNEAYDVDVDVSGPINGLDGSMALMSIEFHDWQLDGGYADVTVEATSLMRDPINAELIRDGTTVEFECFLTNELNASPGFYNALVCVRDELNNPDNDTLTTFFVVPVEVTDETPALTGISIHPDAVALPEQASSDTFALFANYSDNSMVKINSGIEWDAEGFDLNGNPLVEIGSNGRATRLTSRWWGGTAAVTADYEGFQDSANVYCEDPFADRVDVEFGALNEEGGTYTQPEALLGPPTGGGSIGGGLTVCSLGYGGIATLRFTDNVIVDGPGADLIVFENAFYIGECDWDGGVEHAVWNETAIVEVSQDGINWLRMPCDFNPLNITCGLEPYQNPSSFYGLAGNHPVYANVEPDGSLRDGIDPVDPEAAGGDAFDLADVGLDWCAWVRLVDTGDSESAPGTETYDDDGDLILDFGKVSITGAIPGCAGFDGDSIAAINSESPLNVQ